MTGEFNEKDGYEFVDFGGRGGCFPNITWQLRKAYVLEAQPVDDNHPISEARVHYVDAQTFTKPRTLIYDRKGDLWKTFQIGQAHPDNHDDVNKGTGVSVDDSFSMIDVQADHCTTGQFKGQVDPSLSTIKIHCSEFESNRQVSRGDLSMNFDTKGGVFSRAPPF